MGGVEEEIAKSVHVGVRLMTKEKNCAVDAYGRR